MHADTTGPVEYAEKNSIGPQRYDYLDNIKWVLAVLVIFHHAAAIAGLDPFPLNLPRVIQSMQYQSIYPSMVRADKSQKRVHLAGYLDFCDDFPRDSL